VVEPKCGDNISHSNLHNNIQKHFPCHVILPLF